MNGDDQLAMRATVLAQMAATDGPSMDFTIERTNEVMMRDGLGVTISQDAMEQLHWEMSAWVGSRLMRAHDKTGVMPQKVHVSVTVGLDTDEL